MFVVCISQLFVIAELAFSVKVASDHSVEIPIGLVAMLILDAVEVSNFCSKTRQVKFAKVLACPHSTQTCGTPKEIPSEP